jgi:2-polyprenyl-3-methyl-5-hydroxy-6-metoxy-1,4-benzoquinol methylase
MGRAAFNKAFHDEFWASCADFSRYNPGARHRRRAILDLLRRQPFRSLLDVGCGNGELLRLLRANFPDAAYAGADLSPVTIEANRRALPFASFDVLDIQKRGLQRTFDAVVCTEVIEHVDDVASAIGNLAGMVAPGGYLLLTCPTGRVFATERHFGHVAHPTPALLSALVADAGLAMVSLENWGWPVYRLLKYATNVRADWALEKFATGTYSPAAKAVSTALYLANFANLPSSRYGCQLYALARRAEMSTT